MSLLRIQELLNLQAQRLDLNEGSCDGKIGWYCLNPKTNQVYGPFETEVECKKKVHPGNECVFGCPSDEEDKHFIKMKAPITSKNA